MARRPEPAWVKILKEEFYGKKAPNSSFRIPQRQVSEARKAIETEIATLKTTLKDSGYKSEEKSKILEARRVELAREYVEEYRSRVQNATDVNEVQTPRVELSPEETLNVIKKAINKRVATQQGDRRHNEVLFTDSAIDLLAEFYLNKHHSDLNLDRIRLDKRSVIDLLAFIELAQQGRAVTLEEIRSVTGYATPGLTIRIINNLKVNHHPQFNLGSSYVINGNSRGWTLKRVESDLSD